MSAILILGVLVVLSQVLPASAPGLTTVLRAAAGVEILTIAVLMKLVTSQMEPLRAGEDERAWWAVHGPRAIVFWALAEATAAIGGVFWLLARDLLVLMALGGFGLGALIWMRPGKLVD